MTDSLFKSALVWLLVTVEVGCVTTRNTDEPWSYGEFCGPGWPQIVSTSREDRVAKLGAIQAADDIDQLCKEHDICYVMRGRHHPDCDKDLRRNLMAMKFDPGNMETCRKVRDQILYAFSCFQSTGHKPSGSITAPITFPLGMAICAISAPLASLGSLWETPPPGTCLAVNDYKEHRIRTERCIEQAGTDVKQLANCSREYGSPTRSVSRSKPMIPEFESKHDSETCAGINSWKTINGVNCLVDACGKILDNKNPACRDQTD